MMNTVIDCMERGIVPRWIVGLGMRQLMRQRLREEQKKFSSLPEGVRSFAKKLQQEPIAILTQQANEQHYELPTEFFELVLGPRMKYSSCYFDTPSSTLAEAEDAMLHRTVSMAGVQDGMKVLDLGCGWGALSFWLLEKFPNVRVTAFSNSAVQRPFLLERARQRGVADRFEVVTGNMVSVDLPQGFDRILSVEMFEHLRNYEVVFEKVAKSLIPNGQLFIHVFCHRAWPYFFEQEGEDNWMGRYFFSGGIMPSLDLLPQFQRHVRLRDQVFYPGTHYEKTALAWEELLMDRRNEVFPILERVYGTKEAARWFERWRMFFQACAELFGYRDGKEWGVGHYLFEKAA